MSFRLRLTLFFVLIVVLPMVAVAILVSEIASDSANGKTDSRLSAGLRTATNLFEEEQAEAARAADQIADEIAADPLSANALETGVEADVQRLADTYRGRDRLATVELTGANGDTVTAGSPKPLAASSVDLLDDGGAKIGTVTVAATTSPEFLERVESTTGEDAALVGPRISADDTTPIEVGALPAGGETADLERGGDELRVAATEALGVERVRIALFAPAEAEGFLGSRPKLAVALLGFFVIALLAVLLILRSLQGYVRQMFGAARRIGEGDFSEQVPVTGRDEMAGLAGEFNKMSERLAGQMGQLRRQRVQIESSTRRIGEAFASGLDRQALLSILVETAVGTCDADYGLVALSGHVGSEAEAGNPTEATYDAALAAEQRAMREPGPIEVEQNGAYALASSLGRIGTTEAPVGAMTVAREGRPFNRNEREVFLYLVGQASTSVENVALHELVSVQAVTDDLTQLANKRAFRETMDKEAARAARFGHDLSLMILDIDDFKQVNDTYGHLQGDAVLKAIGRILAEESRGIDEPARYGGEEFAVALPETGSAGALELAERVRTRIAAEPVPLVEGGGRIHGTASLGVATMPGAAADVRELIAAADAALYEAKRTGKDRVCVATVDRGTPSAVSHGPEAETAKGPAPARRK